ncbi:hypothetical protein FKP32DRAFT_1679351 [Trametes sanguinea]|nr:hypothetical protein FKP32DRAFT_1679351 [Trametes sanguinea]
MSAQNVAEEELIPSEEAVEQVIGLENDIRTLDECADLDVLQLREDYTLSSDTVDPAAWAEAFALRMVMFNKEYRRSTRQALQGTAHHYTLLFHATGSKNPLHYLLSQCVQAAQASHEVQALYDKFQTIYHARCRDGTLLTINRAMVLRAITRLQNSTRRIKTGEAYVREGLMHWKTCFMLLFMPKYLDNALAALQSRKVIKQTAVEECSQLFERLIDICSQRHDAVADVANEATLLTVTFFAAYQAGVPLDYFGEKLAVFPTGKDRIIRLRSQQNDVISQIHRLAAGARASPATLPGPDGEEVSIATLRQAGEEFEAIRINCIRIQEMAKSTIVSLNTMIENLELGPAKVVVAVQ